MSATQPPEQRDAGDERVGAAATELPNDVLLDLVERWPTVASHEVVVLPRETREGRTYYVDDDVDVLVLARSEDLNASFLHDGPDRRYLHENAAGWELQAALAVAESLGATGIAALCRYLWISVRHAKKRGLFDGNEGEAPVKLTLARVSQNGTTGDVTATAVRLEGQLDDVSTVIERILRPADGA